MATKNNPGAFDCYKDAHPDEPLFILRANDPLAAPLVRLWALARSQRVAMQSVVNEVATLQDRAAQKSPPDPAKIAEAFDCATAMEQWRLFPREEEEVKP